MKIDFRVIKLPTRLRNNCAEPVYNFGDDEIENITQERERDTADGAAERLSRIAPNSLTEHRKPARYRDTAGRKPRDSASKIASIVLCEVALFSTKPRLFQNGSI